MKTIYHAALSRGHANHGWLDTYHSFSFASYYDPERLNFGALRVLNDDRVAAGMGFGTHPHDNMEIVSIPLSGDLEHRDSMGNTTVIRQGDIQIMSAGTGVYHSEYNKNKDREVSFLQIWVLPKVRNIQPRYDQITLPAGAVTVLQTIVSPEKAGAGVWINQDAWFSLGRIPKETQITYTLHTSGNGVYVFLLEGQLAVDGQVISRRDGLGIWETNEVSLRPTQDSHVLLIEVPMR
jgi:hypothetical protein